MRCTGRGWLRASRITDLLLFELETKRVVDLSDYDLVQLALCRMGLNHCPTLRMGPVRLERPSGRVLYVCRRIG